MLHPACRDGKAPKGTGAFVNVLVYVLLWNNVSMRDRPPGDPFIV